MTAKEKYRRLCKTETSIPLFSKDWWLDAVCGEDNWDVAVVENNGEIIGSFPYRLKRKYFVKYILNPKFTPYLGLWLKYPHNLNENKKLSFEKKIINEIINQLPYFNWFNQSLHNNLTNWLPFYWNKFQQSTRYTYLINDLSDIKKIVNDFSYAKKKNIIKAEKQLHIKTGLIPKIFYDLHKNALAEAGKKIFYDLNLLERIYISVKERNCGEFFYTIDKNENIHSALFIVWDSVSGYNLISAINNNFRNSGSVSLLIKFVLEFLQNTVQVFDFEGSMIEGVENSFRQFGAKQTPFFQIQKINPGWLKLLLMQKQNLT